MKNKNGLIIISDYRGKIERKKLCTPKKNISFIIVIDYISKIGHDFLECNIYHLQDYEVYHLFNFILTKIILLVKCF